MHHEISVLVPVYNRQEFLPRLLRSLNDQDMSKDRFMVIIVDDGSDQPVKIDESQYDFKISILRHDRNKGLPAALNTGLKNINSRFFVRIDSDDYVHKSFLSILRLKFELEPAVKVACVDYLKVDQSENIIGVFQSDEKPIGCAVMFKTEIVKVIGLYDEKLLLAEEIDFRNRVQKHYQIHRVALPLYRYVQHESNMTIDDDKYEYYKGLVDGK